MGILEWLFGGSKSASSNLKLPRRQETGRYGKKGQFRKDRPGDFRPRGPNGRYQK